MEKTEAEAEAEAEERRRRTGGGIGGEMRMEKRGWMEVDNKSASSEDPACSVALLCHRE